MTTYTHKLISELEVGDVLMSHGMRLEIDEPLEISDSYGHKHSETPVRFTHARITTFDAIDDDFIRVFAVQDRGPQDPRWTVQSNDLATWTVVTDEDNPVHRVATRTA